MSIFDSIRSVFSRNTGSETVTEKLLRIIELSKELHDNARCGITRQMSRFPVTI